MRATIRAEEEKLADSIEAEEEKLADSKLKVDRRTRDVEAMERTVKERAEAIEALAREKAIGFPWLARAYDEFLELQDRATVADLRNKAHPAQKAADQLGEMARLRRSAERKAKILEYQLRYYETQFPWLTDLTGEDVNDLLIALSQEREQVAHDETAYDAARQWITDAEYRQLSTADKFQLALDRYWSSRRTCWQIGRDYERFVGYLYEREGFKVHYQGIVEGLDDLGRDLVVSKETVQIIQCKNWSTDKLIRENAVNQLFGTLTAYKIDHPGDEREVKGVLYTATRLSDRAKEFADKLGIKYVEDFKLQPYPAIKCNVSHRDNTKIYHLPFDQQYDRTTIDEERLECYVETVAEAEALSFRRAFRWRGSAEGDGAATS